MTEDADKRFNGLNLRAGIKVRKLLIELGIRTEDAECNLRGERIAEVNKIPIDEIFHSSNEEIIPISETEDRNQKVVIFDDHVCEKNQNDIINYFIQGRHKNCCVIYISQSYYKTPKDIRINSSHYIVFESLTKRENEAICNEHGLDKEAYKWSFKNEYDFFCLLINQEMNFYGEL